MQSCNNNVTYVSKNKIKSLKIEKRFNLYFNND